MKKPILVLLVLLFLLILTCVYQKTGVLYAKHNDNPPNTLPTITLQPLPAVKKEPTEVKVQEKVTKVTEVAKVAAVEIAAEKVVVEKEIKVTKDKIEVLPKPVIKQETVTATPPASAKQNDIEEIDALMQALKDREVAFKNRDAFELHIQQLIKQALENRSAAIDHMNKEELHLIELQKELIKARDLAYDKIGQTNIPTSGE